MKDSTRIRLIILRTSSPIVSSNLNGGAPGKIAAHLREVFHGEKVVLPSERKAIALPCEILARYPGTYRLAPEFSLTITLAGDQLMA